MVWTFVRSKYPRWRGAEAEFLRRKWGGISWIGEAGVEEGLLIGAEGRVSPCASILARGNDVSDMHWHVKFNEAVSRKAFIS
jgi:hypothetical protein